MGDEFKTHYGCPACVKLGSFDCFVDSRGMLRIYKEGKQVGEFDPDSQAEMAKVDFEQWQKARKR